LSEIQPVSRRRLTRAQRERIHRIQDLRRRRAQDRAAADEQAMAASGLGPEQEGRVIANFGANVLLEDGQGLTARCVPRQNLNPLVAGDQVVWQRSGPGTGVVVALLPRHTCLARHDGRLRPKPIAANVDLILVVAAPRPPLDEFLLDSYLVAAETLGIEPTVVINKADLLPPRQREALCDRLAHYRRSGYRTLLVSSRTGRGMDTLVGLPRGRRAILVGQSGVGKSSLIQALVPDLDLRVAALSRLTGQGTHTTTAARLYHLPGGGDLIDSPGVRAFSLWPMGADQLAWGFPEFRPHLGRCHFANCTHRVEPRCAIQAAVAHGDIDPRRFENYRRIVDSVGALA
jgi:ribosome biogenesis GTPase